METKITSDTQTEKEEIEKKKKIKKTEKKGKKGGAKKKKAQKEKQVKLKELSIINKEIEDEQNIVEEINTKIKSIEDTIFIGHHELKTLKLELKNKEVELQENKAFAILSSRRIDNLINKCVLECYESFLTNITKNEAELFGYSKELTKDKKNQEAYKEFDKLTNLTNTEHLNKLKSIIFMQNEKVNEINKKFSNSIQEIRRSYSKKLHLEGEELDKKRQHRIFQLQKEKNETIKNILAEYNEKVLSTQNYFKLILQDQIEMIQELEEEKLNKKKYYFSKIKNLEEIKKNISIQKKKLDNLNKEVIALNKNIVDFEKLKNQLNKIKEKRKKQVNVLKELKLETDVKKMLYTNLLKEYEKIYNEQKISLCIYLQRLLLESHFLEMKIKRKEESLEINSLELNKWKESLDIEQNDILNNALEEKFQNFNQLKKEVECLMDTNKKNIENYEALIHLNYGVNDELDNLKRQHVL